ncbi:MAG: hypothetical protein KF819_11265 [Labilithrix sp.]|nr:hypothetical protein [Labilithrix sp.]
MSRVDRTEERSRALHRAVAEKIRADAGIVRSARERVLAWRAAGTTHPHYCDAWLEVLDSPPDALIAFLESDTERSRELRQASPFAGALDPRERWRILRRNEAPK